MTTHQRAASQRSDGQGNENTSTPHPAPAVGTTDVRGHPPAGSAASVTGYPALQVSVPRPGHARGRRLVRHTTLW